MDLNRFSILNRLNAKQIQLICEEFNIEYVDIYLGTQTENINFELCDFICKFLGYKKWYPKYHPKGMGKKEGWVSYKEGNKAVKRAKKNKKAKIISQ